jgi:ectoine hydroxylase-related dioxygenase (phytanoyl-CoA dioxygenase family)
MDRISGARTIVGMTSLSPAELASYRERGYLLKRGLFGWALTCSLSREIEELHEKMARKAPAGVHLSWEQDLAPGRSPRIRQLMHSEKVSPIIDAMSRSPEILDVMQALIGPDIYLFHSKLMMKAAHDGSFTPWHQDWGYWQHESLEPSHVNCMLFIDRADAENGTIRFVEGSHLAGATAHRDFASDSFRLGLEGGLDAYDATLLEMEPGDAVFFGPLVIHGSGPNVSSRDRRANTFAYDKPNNQKRGALPADRYRRGAMSAQAIAI